MRSVAGQSLAGDENVNEATFASILVPPHDPAPSPFSTPAALIDTTPSMFSWAGLVGSGGVAAPVSPPPLIRPRLLVVVAVASEGDVTLTLVP